MGAKTQRALSYQQQAAAQAQATTAAEQQASNERTFGAASQMLGSDEQLAGYGVDTGLEAYTGRYSLDEGTFASIMGSSSKLIRQKDTYLPQMQQIATEANALMQQAEDAARAGNFEQAEQLRAQAQGGLGKIGGQAWASAFRMSGPSATTRAKGLLSSPQAMIVGGQIKQAREFQDWNSQGSQDWRARMSEAGERSIAAESQSALRSARDFGLQRGAGRMAGAAAAINADTLRRAATERAQVHAQTNAAFEGFRHNFAQSAVSFAQNWLSGQAGVRESAQQMQFGVSQMAAQLYGQGSQLSAQFSAQASADKQASDAKSGAIYGAVGSVAGAVGGSMFGAGGALAQAGSGQAAS